MKVTKTGKTLEAIADDVFIPKARQRRIKAKFWASWREGPSKGEPTLSAAIEVTKCSTIETWAQEPGFTNWFMNDQDHQQRLEYLFDMGLDMLEDTMQTAEKAADRLKAFEYVAKLAHKLTKQETEIKYLDKEIQTMSEAEIEKLIKKHSAPTLPGGSDEKEE